MAKIRTDDLPVDETLSKDEMRQVGGGTEGKKDFLGKLQGYNEMGDELRDYLAELQGELRDRAGGGSGKGKGGTDRGKPSDWEPVGTESPDLKKIEL